MRISRLLVAVTATMVVGAGACGSGPSSTAGSLNVFAASSLTDAFNSARTALATATPGLMPTYNFAGSNALVAQIQQGAPADVFASADTKNMQKLVDAGLVETPVTFAKNKLQIAVAAGNPKHIATLADLATPGVTVVLGAVGVPAGDYAREVLAAKAIVVTPVSLEADVKSALSKVTSGEADATVVYLTDVTAGGDTVAGVAVPDADQPSITYPIAVLRSSTHRAAALAFVTSAVSGDVQRELQAAGFAPPQ